MAIIIPHRFIDRLVPDKKIKFIDSIIIGTFNPGLPIIRSLSADELQLYEQIQFKKKFQKFNEVKNFYDRPQNRFWKIMDVMANPHFYCNSKDFKEKNRTGLKYYSKLDRELIFRNQTEFCKQRGILITDIVRQIEPTSFDKIYDNFPDTMIERSASIWNTEGILSVIKKYNPKRILINFSLSQSLPKISEEINKIRDKYPEKVVHVMSTSGAAANNYIALVNYWHPIFKN
ncbi:MAG: hypothetical protein QM687_03175 [Ferruginibacter sp.]